MEVSLANSPSATPRVRVSMGEDPSFESTLCKNIGGEPGLAKESQSPCCFHLWNVALITQTKVIGTYISFCVLFYVAPGKDLDQLFVIADEVEYKVSFLSTIIFKKLAIKRGVS